MNLVFKHIHEYLDAFVSHHDATFEIVFNELQNSHKGDAKPLLNYVDRILSNSQNNNEIEFRALHIHFEENFEDYTKLLVAEFLIVRSFYIHKEKDNSLNINDNLINEILKISNKVRQALLIPINFNKAKENKIRQDRKDLRGKLKFYQGLGDKVSLCPKSLVNLQNKTCNPLLELFKSKIYAISLSQFSKINSYLVLNTENGINQLDNYENLLNNLENIILFDCERKRDFLEYRYNLLQEWNANNGTSFRNLLILTFGKDEPNINRLKNITNLIKDRFQIPTNSTYVISKEECAHLLNYTNENSIIINFCEDTSSTFWEVFELETSIRDLYELRSIKMLNIYSLTFNKEIKEYILENIFSPDKQSSFLSSESKQVLLACPSEDIATIRDSLSNALEVVIQSNWVNEIKKHTADDTVIVLPEDVLKDDLLRNKVVDMLQLSRRNKLLSWDKIDFHSDKPTLILSYRDQGRFQYYFYPNILESKFYRSPMVNAVFLNVFFKTHYDWALYNLQRDKCKYLTHSLRQEFFAFPQLEKEIATLKPQKSDTINWDLENEYIDSENRTVVKVKFKGVRNSRTFTKSDLFIFNFKGEHTYRIERIEDLMSIDLTEESLSIQHLDEIQEEINIYEKLNTVNNQDEELKIIRSHFKIDDNEPGKLWKILLKTKSETKGEKEFYRELEAFLKSKDLKIVSLSHFQNTWANPDSDSITPLSKRVFVAICEFLKIPKIYFIIMQRIKNASKQATRHSTRQMSSLLKDLFNDSCFDANSKAKEILEGRLDNYKKKHPLDEIGINENYLLDNLVTLVELIQPEIKLLEVETIETVEQ